MTDLSRDDLVLAANTIRGLSMDGVQKANSGHPGMPMGMADVASVLFLKHLKHHSAASDWPDRDRFVLSAGHGSMLIYSLLHLCGYDMPMEELQKFRQYGSRTPGHPEHGDVPGVETTTGPLGQGCGNSVGMALAEAMLAARYNNKTFSPVDHRVYVIAGDGDMMEGLSHESFSLAGHLGLHKLIVFYDDNKITIEGATDLAYSDNPRARFEGYNWNVLEIDGHDYDQIEDAIQAAQAETARPTLIVTRTHIAHGAPNAHDTSDAHGAPLGDEEVRAAKQNLGLPADQTFYVPDRVRELFAARSEALASVYDAWQTSFAAYGDSHPDLAAAWTAAHDLALPDDLEAGLPDFSDTASMATRKASQAVIQTLAAAVPYLVGGSADLAPSTNTLIKDAASVARGEFAGRNLHFGVREHAMCAMLNGMALHGGLRTYGATFFTFSDYCRPALRLAAIMHLPVTYVFTHDSIYVGEDGPTHQPVEHLPSLRAMHNLTIIRPGDAAETSHAWAAALRNTHGPSALLLTRQNLPTIDRNVCAPASGVARGAYTLWQSGSGPPDLLLMASGSELGLILDAALALADEVNVRVVSMPSWEIFEAQAAGYREEVLPADCRARLAVEAAAPFGWERYVGDTGRVHGITGYGASGPCADVAKAFGFTPENIVGIAREVLAAAGQLVKE